MLQNKHNILFLGVLLATIFLPQSLAQDSDLDNTTGGQLLHFNSPLISSYEGKGEPIKFLLQINEELPNNDTIIIITAQGTFEGSEPDIFINSDKFSVSTDSKIICKSFGFALCHFKFSEINSNQLFIAVKCNQVCGFELTALSQQNNAFLTFPLNSVRYFIFDESSGKAEDKRVILQKVAQLRYQESDLDNDSLEHILVEFEIMNPIESNSFFNVLINFNEKIPTRTQNQGQGMGLSAGSGYGVLVQSKTINNFQIPGINTYTIEAHGGTIIAVRSYGWGNVKKIKPYESCGGFTDQQDMLIQLELESNPLSWQLEQNLILGLVPFQGNPNIYADTRSFEEISNLKDYKWVSDEWLDDRLVITPKQILGEKSVFIRVNSADDFSFFKLRAYFPRGKTPLSFDYPEAGSLDPDESVVYSLSLFGKQISQITITLQPREGNPGLFVKRCNVDQKEECEIPETYTNPNKPQFVGEPVVLSFQSKSSDCTKDKLGGLTVCYYIIGVINKNESKRAKYTLKASNGSIHKLLRPNKTAHDVVEFGKISYYKLDLSNRKYVNITQVSFQLSSVSGQVTMLADFTETHPNINTSFKYSFFHSLHLYAEEMGNLNRTIYLGVQADSSLATFNLQANIIRNDSLAFIELQENSPLLVTENSDKVKSIHFKFIVRKNFDKDIKVRLIIEHINGFYIMTAGLSPESLDLFSTENNVLKNINNNILEFSSNQFHQDTYEQPIYGAITPIKGSLGSTLQFKITFTTDRVTHQTLSIGIMNQITIGDQQKAYFKIPIHSHESLSISKKVTSANGSQTDVDVIASYDQANINPDKGELNTIEINHFSPSIIQETSFKLNCKQIEEFTVQDNCFLFLTVIGQVPNTVLFLYAEYNAQETILFSDFPNFISFKPGEEKKLFFPVISAKSFNLFKTSSVYGDTIKLCAKLVNNSADRKLWPYPLECKKGTYDMKFSTEQDENYVQEIGFFYENNTSKNFDFCDLNFFDVSKRFQIPQSTNSTDTHKVCDLAKNECALAVVLKDTSVKPWGDIDTLILILQQSQTMLQPSQIIMDSLPLNGVRFYSFECGFKAEKCIIKATEFVDTSVELSVFSGSNLLAKNEKNQPSIEINKEFKKIHKDKIVGNQFTLAAKNLQANKEITYSILLTIEHENSTSFIPISPGMPLQIQLSSSEDIRYFLFTNKQPKTPFKIALTQQTQGYTQITVALYNDKLQQDCPLKEFIDQTYDSLLVIEESDLYCNSSSDLCSYIIQLSTQQPSGSLFQISVSSVEAPNSILLLENIDSQNELEATQKAFYRFNVMKQSQLEITVLKGELQMTIVCSVNTQKQIVSEDALVYPKSFVFPVGPLETINQNYIIQFVAKKPSKFVVSFINEDTIPLINFDLPLKNQVIRASSYREYAILNSGDLVINIQLQFTCSKSQENICKTAISEKFLSENNHPIQSTIIGSVYENYSQTFIKHLQIFPQDSHNRISMTLSNSQPNQSIGQLTVYASQNFFLLDFDTPMFFFLDGLIQETSLFGIILPEKQQKILVEISCYKGDVRAMGTYSRDSALNNLYEYSFQGDVRKILEVEVVSSNFYIQMKGLNQNTQGYIKFVAFPSNTQLPWTAFKLPEFSRPKIQGIVNAQTKSYEKVQIQFESMNCIKLTQVHYNVIDQFELNLVTYSLIFTKERQLAYSTDNYFTQIQDDLSSIEVQLPYYDGAKSEETLITKKPLLFFNIADKPKCYLYSQPCSSKIVTVPLDNQQFQTYTSDGQVAVIVRVQVIWKHKLTGVFFTQTFYYSEETYNPEVLFIAQPDPEENIQSANLLPIVFLAVGGMVLLGGLAYFFFRKYKRTTNILNFELTDVRNVANLAIAEQAIQKSQLKHIPFKDEDQNGGEIE